MHQALSEVKHIVAIASGKGGVGKSTVSSNLAVALNETGAKVGLLDADIYGPSQPGMLGSGTDKPKFSQNEIYPITRHGVNFVSMGLLLGEDAPVIWRAPMAMKMIQQFLGNVAWGELDYLLIDLPPGTGDVQLTLAQQASLSGAIIVTTPQQVSLGVARKGLRMFQEVNVPIIGILENMSGFTCEHCGKVTDVFKTGGGKQMAEQLGLPFLGALPLDPEFMQSGEEGVPVLARSKDSAAAKSLLGVAEQFKESLQKVVASGGEAPLDIELNENGDLVLVWPDGQRDVLKPYDLRINCPCAQCVDEDTGEKILNPKRVQLDIQVKSAQPVGRYALMFEFSDGHNTGIYKFKTLKEIAKKGSDSESFSV